MDIRTDEDVAQVTAALLTESRGHYQAHVASSVDEPGVWSGAELIGKARRYGARYRESRFNLMRRAGCTPCWRTNPKTGRQYRSVCLLGG